MNWTNVGLIFRQSLLAQMRDRRMVLLYVVLPLMIYPIIGLAAFQVSQFVHETPLTVRVYNIEDLPPGTPLLEGTGFVPDLFSRRDDARLLIVKPARAEQAPQELPSQVAGALYFPPGFADQLATYQQRLFDGEADPSERPSPEIIFDAGREDSNTARRRLREVIISYGYELARTRLTEADLPAEAADPPLRIRSSDIAVTGDEGTIVWARIFPLLLVVWALTGAFHPAVDLCPGEKERGTLETLLCSPAGRLEIVYGKLLTIMVYSTGTVVLNLTSMGITGTLLLRQLPGFGPPPLEAALWLALALPPITLLFSALCLAIATFARSTVEGHYYMMPLFLMLLPVALTPLAPGAQLSLGLSLVPVAGLVSLLRTLIEGNHELALTYAAPVLGITLACAWAALRWAEQQFRQEAVLFRAGERVDMTGWMRRFYAERGSTPGPRSALACGVALWTMAFVLGTSLPQARTPQGFLWMMGLTQIMILVVALLATAVRARSFRRTLLLRWPRWWTIPLAIVAALAWHPVSAFLAETVVRPNFPVATGAQGQLAELLEPLFALPLWQLLIAMALLPAICEEAAFRGFVLTGLRKPEKMALAIGLSALLFGLTHIILQQSVMATITGLILGWIAWHAQSLLPCILFHFTNNATVLVLQQYGDEWAWLQPWIDRTVTDTGEVVMYQPSVLVVCGIVLALCLVLFARSDPSPRRTHR